MKVLSILSCFKRLEKAKNARYKVGMYRLELEMLKGNNRRVPDVVKFIVLIKKLACFI